MINMPIYLTNNLKELGFEEGKGTLYIALKEPEPQLSNTLKEINYAGFLAQLKWSSFNKDYRIFKVNSVVMKKVER